jgi:hypothetical protein
MDDVGSYKPSRATGKSWWSISEQDKYDLSLLSKDKGMFYFIFYFY